jgi:hypothetical protein
LRQVAEQRFCTLNAPVQGRDVVRGVRYTDSIAVPTVASTQQAVD